MVSTSYLLYGTQSDRDNTVYDINHEGECLILHAADLAVGLTHVMLVQNHSWMELTDYNFSVCIGNVYKTPCVGVKLLAGEIGRHILL